MQFDPGLAQTRFGYGRSPVVAGPESTEDMIQRLRGPDEAAAQFAVPQTAEANETVRALFEMRSAFRKIKKDNTDRQAARQAFVKARRAAFHEALGWVAQDVLRRIWSRDALRERLVAFWADHFSAPGKNQFYRYAESAYVETAIRPYVAGRFEDMLIAAATHPQMLAYLDQNISVGPNSEFTARKVRKDENGRPYGINENLAREILELHTLGVEGRYTQADVRQLAELLTGLSATVGKEMRYRPARAEPGAETVLGQTYGKRRARLEDIHAALRDLARHPDTARHIAKKLVVHFVSDQPDPEMVEAMTQRYLDSGGDLVAVVAAMLQHPAAWRVPAAGEGNIKQPDLFVSSAMRGLAVSPTHLQNMKPHILNRTLLQPLRRMGQPWRRPLGPDGFEEGDGYWVSAQGMGARLHWAMSVPSAMLDDLPDPRGFVETVLGAEAPEVVRFAAGAAETKREGLALVLMSPAFQRV